jgi:FG-GAP-like repeat
MNFIVLVRNILLIVFALFLPASSALADFVAADFDGDGKADYSIFRPTGIFFILKSSDSSVIIHSLGRTCDQAINGDFDGDGKADFGIWRPSTGEWWIQPSGGVPSIIVRTWGIGSLGDIPAPSDYNGDGKTDMAIYRSGTWYILQSPAWILPATIASFGASGDIPVAATYKTPTCP